MVLMTMIARVGDGLALCASMHEEEERPLDEYRRQAKQIFRKLNQQSPDRFSIESSNKLMFHYIISQAVCYLVLCEQSFSKKLAFAYLNEIQSEFFVQYGARIASQTRPYCFIEFETYIQRSRKSYMDSRTKRNLNLVSNELQDVQRIMVGNLDDILGRGTQLSEIGNKATMLADVSKKYRDDAHSLNLRSSHIKLACGGILTVVLMIYLRFFWFV